MVDTKDFKIDIDEHLSIEIVKIADIDWYVNSIFKPFFYEHLEYKPGGQLDKLKVKAKLTVLIGEYNFNNKLNSDVRLIIKLDGKNVGGVTIIQTGQPNNIELAYWVLPENQGKGIAIRTLKGLIKYIKKEYNEIEIITLQILEGNHSSIKIANKLGFKKFEKQKTNSGRLKIIYRMDIGRVKSNAKISERADS